MRTHLFFLIILFTPAKSVFALHAPSKTEMQALQSQINAIHALQGSTDAKNPLNRSGIKGLNENIREENRTIDPDKKKIAAWEQQLKNLEAQQAPLCQKLLDDTRTYYGIKPNRWSGKIVLPGKFNGSSAVWNPKFGAMESTRVKTNRAGHSIVMGQPEPYDAITWENGDIIVTIEAFKFSPGYLAAVINHETIHFDQFTTPGRGDKSSSSAREREAYNMMRGLTNKNVFRLSPDEEETLKDRFEKAINNTTSSPNGSMLGDPGFYSIDLTLNPNGEDLLINKMREARNQASQHKERLELERRRDHDARLRNTKADMAARSCANPGSVTQAELNALPEPYDENLVFTPPRGLDACSYSVYMRLGRGVDAEEIRSASEPNILARPDPPADIPSVVRPIDTPSVVRPIDNPPLANSSPRFMFSSFFPNLKDLAVKACLSPANTSLTPNAIPPFSNISFAGDFDDQRAASLSAGMAECPRQLFYKLIEMIRSEKGAEIDNQWLRNMASLYSAPVYVPRPWSGGDPCRDNGNERCPKP